MQMEVGENRGQAAILFDAAALHSACMQGLLQFTACRASAWLAPPHYYLAPPLTSIALPLRELPCTYILPEVSSALNSSMRSEAGIRICARHASVAVSILAALLHAVDG